MTKEEYFKDLEIHDWYFAYSDDFGVYSRGKENVKKLYNAALHNDILMNMFNDYSKYMFAEDRSKTKSKLEDY